MTAHDRAPAAERAAEPDVLHATRAFYDAVAADYDDRFRDALAARPLDQALLAAFAGYVRGSGPVADLGCGPGRTTAYLHGLGLAVSGIDLSPRMVELARAAHPGLRFEVGSITALDLPDGTLGGLLAWYSTIHLPVERLPQAFAEFHRVLAPGGHALLAFQTGDEPLRVDRPFGHPVALDFQRRRPERVAELLAEAGFVPHARVEREPEMEDSTRQAFLLVRKP
ncbi:class I SAM-dependent methyltransferase [Streptomyces sp. B1866]|uniref:class I SAM-dependent DNA methyltransferase n=1 Tax=Streptomyces sp. B1866 TaxID=3075431 RepID=UPI00289212A1|nr:class I SAM-dependent methyltransferase [Streptomyces sp. B1866]MDT3398135.1 class I SAM-dependent methyltransferase [Streptomyces sp. B1866]